MSNLGNLRLWGAMVAILLAAGAEHAPAGTRRHDVADSGRQKLAGIVSFIAYRDGDPDSNYGDAMGVVRISSHLDWLTVQLSAACTMEWIGGSGGLNVATNWRTTFDGTEVNAVPGALDAIRFNANGILTKTGAGTLTADGPQDHGDDALLDILAGIDMPEGAIGAVSLRNVGADVTMFGLPTEGVWFRVYESVEGANITVSDGDILYFAAGSLRDSSVYVGVMARGQTISILWIWRFACPESRRHRTARPALLRPSRCSGIPHRLRLVRCGEPDKQVRTPEVAPVDREPRGERRRGSRAWGQCLCASSHAGPVGPRTPSRRERAPCD